MLVVYRALFRSVIDYDCIVFESASTNQKKILDTIQYKALTITFGALKGTSLAALKFDCGECSWWLSSLHHEGKRYAGPFNADQHQRTVRTEAERCQGQHGPNSSQKQDRSTTRSPHQISRCLHLNEDTIQFTTRPSRHQRQQCHDDCHLHHAEEEDLSQEESPKVTFTPTKGTWLSKRWKGAMKRKPRQSGDRILKQCQLVATMEATMQMSDGSSFMTAEMEAISRAIKWARPVNIKCTLLPSQIHYRRGPEHRDTAATGF